MTKLLYLDDSYLKETTAKIASIQEIEDNKVITLDQTIFYPKGGGQPTDKGKVIKDGQEYNVLEVYKYQDNVYHVLDNTNSLNIGDEVILKLDWNRRYRLMKMHTAAHIICKIINQKTGALITGNQLDVEKSRIDFNLENYDKEQIISFFDDINNILKQNLDITTDYIDRNNAPENLTFLAKGLPESIKKIRFVKIGDIDIQADGGTHIKNTSEINKIIFLKSDNKGKSNRRLYFTLE